MITRLSKAASFAVLAVCVSPALAQDEIVWSTIDGGGGTCTDGVLTIVDATIGQPDAGEMSGGGYTILGGYWDVGGTTPCDSIDFNNDGLFPDTADIDDFLSVFSGGPCSTAPTPGCSDIDFNNDSLFPDTADIDALLMVFSGGACQ